MRIPPDGPPPLPTGESAPEKLRLGALHRFDRVNTPAGAHRDDDANDVRSHFLATTASAPGPLPYAAPPRSRRTRDFLVLLTMGNATIAVLVALAGLNPVTLIFGLAGIVVFTTGLAWVVYGIMDNY